MECLRCGISEQENRLVDAIFHNELVKVCVDCAEIMSLTVIKRPTSYQLKTAERTVSVYERLSRYQGLPLKDVKKEKIVSNVEKENITLKDLIDKRIKIQIDDKRIDNRYSGELIDNFHWVIMRARRGKKLTQEQLAKEIGEAEMTIKMIEQGKLPGDGYKIISKLEAYLNVKLTNGKGSELLTKAIPKRLEFDPVTLKNLTIADLKRMKEEREVKERQEKIEGGEIEGDLDNSEDVESTDKIEKEKKWWEVWR